VVVAGLVVVIVAGLVVTVVGCVVVVAGLVVTVVGCVVVVVVVAGLVAASSAAFFASRFKAFCAFVILFCTSVLFTFLFRFGIPRNPSVGAIITHVTKSITKRNIIERIIPLSNMVVILYKTLIQIREPRFKMPHSGIEKWSTEGALPLDPSFLFCKIHILSFVKYTFYPL